MDRLILIRAGNQSDEASQGLPPCMQASNVTSMLSNHAASMHESKVPETNSIFPCELQVSPIKIVKNPDGSLQRAAMTQSALSKERRELREQQQRTLLEAIPKDLSRPWEDPLPEQVCAQQMRPWLPGFETPWGSRAYEPPPFAS